MTRQVADRTPLHPVLQATQDRAIGLPTIDTQPLDSVRAAYEARKAQVPRRMVASVGERMFPGPRGPCRVRIYRPDACAGHAVLLFLHGGGFAICSLDTHDALCREICVRARSIVVALDYALAPENPYPAALDDCRAALDWVAACATEFGGDPARLALAGDSAGGNLAAVTALCARDGAGPPLLAQLLLYPVADYPSDTPSYVAHANGIGLTGDIMRWFFGLYLGQGYATGDPHVAPLRAPDLARLPPAYIVTAGHDPLRDEGAAYAARLRDAGGEVVHRDYPDMNHGFLVWTSLVDRADAALDDACAWLRTRLSVKPA